MMEDYKAIAKLMKEKGSMVAFTGAGISVDSGIPAFRGGQGLWEKYDPMEYAEIRAFTIIPKGLGNVERDVRGTLNQNQARLTLPLGNLKKGILRSVITQNVDGLHHVAGNRDVIEYHGNHRWLVCPNCSKKMPLAHEVVSVRPYPRCEKCHTALKPDVIFFGEGIPKIAAFRANEEANVCNTLLIIGTSGVVYPAAEVPFIAKSNGRQSLRSM